MMDIKDLRMAVLIDADNVTYKSIGGIMKEIPIYGTPTIKRIYGDWTKPTLEGWKGVLLENAITPVQQYSYTIGKNSSDSALIIDAMDILYSEKVEAFCIVSSDSDFTRLAIRLREAGKIVIGIGERKTPKPFITACDKFIYLDIIDKNNIQDEDKGEKKKVEPNNKKKSPAEKHIMVSEEIISLIASSVSDVADESGWAFLGDVGNLINKKKPDFDPRMYGFNKLTPLIRKIGLFEIDERDTTSSRIKHIYIRNKSEAKS